MLRVPRCLSREWFACEGAGAGDFDGNVVELGEGEDVWEVGPCVGRRWRFVRLREAEVVDDELGVRVVAGHLTED